MTDRYDELNEKVKYWAIEPEDRKKIIYWAEKLCGGSDRERDAGNALLVLMNYAVPCIEGEDDA